MLKNQKDRMQRLERNKASDRFVRRQQYIRQKWIKGKYQEHQKGEGDNGV